MPAYVQEDAGPAGLKAAAANITEVAKTVPQDWAFPFPAEGIPVLMYHSISNLPGNSLGVPPEKFALQMKYLYNAGFTTITPDQLYSALQGKTRLPRRPIMITFDDGYHDNFTAAFPVLKQYNFKATFFVVTGYIGPGMLTWDEIKQMAGAGMNIESHTVNHLDLRTLPPARMRKELADSKTAIESNLGTKVEYFCYPAGKFNSTTLALLKDLGYKMAFTTVAGTVRRNQPLLQLRRIRINGLAGLEGFQKQLPN